MSKTDFKALLTAQSMKLKRPMNTIDETYSINSINKNYQLKESIEDIDKGFSSTVSINTVHKQPASTVSMNSIDKKYLYLRGQPLDLYNYLRSTQGQRISFGKMVKHLNISSASVRTALNILKKNGHVKSIESFPGCNGYSVYELREVLK